MSGTSTYIVIKQWITSLEGPTEFVWNGEHHATHKAAVSAGFDDYACDDFNVGRVERGRLVWFGWMDKELPGYDREDIERWIGLVTR